MKEKQLEIFDDTVYLKPIANSINCNNYHKTTKKALSGEDAIISYIFLKHYKEGLKKIRFNRDEIIDACNYLGIKRIDNLGAMIYTYRYRKKLPLLITNTAPKNLEWIIVGSGFGIYEFRLTSLAKITLVSNQQVIKISDATPQIVKEYTHGNDEQALLTKIRYNKLVDNFLGLTCYSLQNHLRTTVNKIQIEIDEIYIGINKEGKKYIIPCQAKSPKDRLGIVQVIQDIRFCRQNYSIQCKPLAIQLLSKNSLAMLELAVTERDDIFFLSVVNECYYQLTN